MKSVVTHEAIREIVADVKIDPQQDIDLRPFDPDHPDWGGFEYAEIRKCRIISSIGELFWNGKDQAEEIASELTHDQEFWAKVCKEGRPTTPSFEGEVKSRLAITLSKFVGAESYTDERATFSFCGEDALENLKALAEKERSRIHFETISLRTSMFSNALFFAALRYKHEREKRERKVEKKKVVELAPKTEAKGALFHPVEIIIAFLALCVLFGFIIGLMP